MKKNFGIFAMKNSLKLSLYVDTPKRVCVSCGETYLIPEKAFVPGAGWPTIWCPRCPKCQEPINEELKKELVEKAKSQDVAAYRYRKANLNEYLAKVGVPYPKELKNFGREGEIKKLVDLLAGNQWIVFSGMPGTGKSYTASMVFRSAAVNEELKEKSFLYRSITHLIGDVKQVWDETGFNTGEKILRECSLAGVLCLEINDIENTGRTTQYRNEVLFKIIDQRYVQHKKGLFCPTIFIIVTEQGKSLWKTLSGQGIDEAVIGRIIEIGSRNMFQFNSMDFRKSIAQREKRIEIIK
jgi:DNA replication protein DnaC